MSDRRKLVVVISRGMDDERASVAWSIANSGVATGFEVLVFLVSAGADWVRRGGASAAHLNPLDPPMRDMVQNVLAHGAVQVCPPCAKVRGYGPDQLLDGVTIAGAPAMLEWVKAGAATLSF